ncbi:MAG: hypothetical protein D3922_04155 [Candidatus Electrothrix sp. AR1]|nr:hypothetical protein [Candidatus Electrothrix sp. AR1]
MGTLQGSILSCCLNFVESPRVGLFVGLLEKVGKSLCSRMLYSTGPRVSDLPCRQRKTPVPGEYGVFPSVSPCSWQQGDITEEMKDFFGTDRGEDSTA